MALSRRFSDVQLVAPAVSEAQRGTTPASVKRGLQELIRRMKSAEGHREAARLSVWAYEPASAGDFELLWGVFGKAAWIELIPLSLVNKNIATRIYVQDRLKAMLALMHVIAHEVYNNRRSSPLAIPFRNFRNRISSELCGWWYRNLNTDELAKFLKSSNAKFRQLKTESRAFADDRSLIFSPVADEVCHGQPHPVGDDDECFLQGRFRFGTALYPGFHYDVRAKTGLLQSVVYDCEGDARDLKPERRAYINIFPNDHLLPARS